MTAADDKLAGLRVICPEAAWRSEAGKDYVYLPGLKVSTDGRVIEMDALLRPGEHSGYASRLFLVEALPAKGRGGAWTAHAICGRTWHTWSWNNVPATLPLAQMLLEHLWALR